MTYGTLNPMLWGCAEIPVFDDARTAAYVNAITKDWMPCGRDYGGLHSQTYTTPAEDRPWWVSDAHPESKLFAGLFITKVTGLYGPAPYERDTLRLASAGHAGQVATWRKPQWQERTILVEGTAHGATCCSVDYGLRVFAETMRGCCSEGCEGSCLRTLRPGGCATDPCGIITETVICAANILPDDNGQHSERVQVASFPSGFVLTSVRYTVEGNPGAVVKSAVSLDGTETDPQTYGAPPVATIKTHTFPPFTPADPAAAEFLWEVTGATDVSVRNVEWVGYVPVSSCTPCIRVCTPGAPIPTELCVRVLQTDTENAAAEYAAADFPDGFTLNSVEFDIEWTGDGTPFTVDSEITDDGAVLSTITTSPAGLSGTVTVTHTLTPFVPTEFEDALLHYTVNVSGTVTAGITNIRWIGTTAAVCPEPELPDLTATVISSPWVNLHNVAVAEGPEIIERGDDLGPCCGCSTTVRWRMVLIATDPRLYGDPASVAEVTVDASNIPCDITGNCFSCDTVDTAADPTCVSLPLVELPDPTSCACIPPVTQKQLFEISIPDTPFPVFATVTIRTASQPIDGLQIRWWRKRPGMAAGHPFYTPCNSCGGAIISHIEASSRLVMNDRARLRKPGGVNVDATRRLYTPGGAPWPGAIELGCGEWIMEVRWGTTTDPSGTTIKIEVAEALP